MVQGSSFLAPRHWAVMGEGSHDVRSLRSTRLCQAMCRCPYSYPTGRAMFGCPDVVEAGWALMFGYGCGRDELPLA
jgi:hypothetical protein